MKLATISILTVSLLLLSSTITMVAPPMEASAQVIANSTSPYAMEGTAFSNMTGTFWKDSRYWIFNAGNATYSEKSFPYLGTVQPDYPIKWDEATETFIHDDTPYTPPPPQPSTPPPPQPSPQQNANPEYVPPNYINPEQMALMGIQNADPVRDPINIDTEDYTIRETVRADGTIVGIQNIFGIKHLIIDGVAKPYFVEETNDKVIIRTNSAGGVIYDKPTCSYSIYESGWGSNSLIPAVSFVGRQADINTDNWEELAINSSSCSVSISESDGKVTLTSTKGSMSGEGVEHELIISPESGIKETFRVATTDAGKKLAVTQTAHIGNELVIGDTTYNIAELNGLVMDRAMIEAEEAQIFEITQGLNYDIGAGWDRLWAITFEDNGIFADNKINLDYANNTEVEETFLEIDPTWTTTIGASSGTLYGIKTSGGASSSCGTEYQKDVLTTSGTGLWGMLRPTSSTNADSCMFTNYQADTSAISDDVIITDVDFNITVGSIPGWSNIAGFNCRIYDVSTDLSGALTADMFADVTSGNIYHDGGTSCFGAGTTTYDLGEQAVTDLQNNLSNDFFALALSLDTHTRNSNDVASGDITDHSLSVGYTLPPPYLPPPPTNLATGNIESSQVNLSWNEPAGPTTEEMPVTGYRVYKSDYGFSNQNLPADKQGDSDQTVLGAVTASEMADNELLFHFDKLEGQTGTTNLDVDDIIAYYELEGSIGTLDGTVSGAVTTASNIGNWAGDLGQAIQVQTGTTPATPTFEEDFSTDTWTAVGSTVSISGGDLSASSVNTNTDDRMHKGLGFTLSNSAWVTQFEVTLQSSNYVSIITLSDGANTLNAYDSIHVDYGSSNLKMREYNGSSMGLDSSGIATSINTPYFVTLTRLSETELQMDVRTGSHTGTLVGSETGTISNGTIDLDTIQSGAYGRQAGSAGYDLDNVKIYNDMTSTSTPVYTSYRAEQYQSGTTTTTGEITEAVNWANFNNSQEHPTHPDGTISQTSSSGGGWRGFASSDKTWSAASGFTVIGQEHPTTGDGPSNYYDSNMIGITDEWTTFADVVADCSSSPMWNCGYKHQGASDSNEFTFFTESPDQRRISCGGAQYNHDSSGNISSNHEMKIEVLSSGTVNFYWDGSTTPLQTCTGASGDYRTFFGGYAGNSSGGIETTVTYEGDVTTPVYSYRNFGDLQEDVVGQQFGSAVGVMTSEQSSGGNSSPAIYYINNGWQRQFYGQEFNTGHELIGKTIKSVTLQMEHNNPNAVYKLVKLDSSDTKTDLEDVDMSWVASNGGLAEYVFDGFTEFTLNAGDKIGIYSDGVSGGNSGNWIKVERHTSDVDSNANTYQIHDTDTGDVTGGDGVDLKYSIGYEGTNYADLIGTTIDNFQLRLEKVGSPTGTATVGVFDQSGNLQQSFGSYDLSTTTYSEYGVVVPSSEGTVEGTPSINGDYTTYTGNHSGTICDENAGSWNTGTTGYNNMYKEQNGGWCVFPSLKYDITNMPSDKYAKSISLEMPITLANAANTGCTVYGITLDPAVHYSSNSNPQPLVENMLNGNQYITDDSFCESTGTKTINLNQQAVTDYNKAITDGQGWFAVGFYFEDKDRAGSHERVTYTSGSTKLIVDYGSGSFVGTTQGAEDKTFTSSTPYQIQTDDILGMKKTGTDANNFVQLHYGKAGGQAQTTGTFSVGNIADGTQNSWCGSHITSGTALVSKSWYQTGCGNVSGINDSEWDLSTEDWSINLWVQKESYSSNDYIWQMDPDTSPRGSQMYMYFNSGNKQLYGVIYDAEGTDLSTASGSYPFTFPNWLEWNMYTYVFDDSEKQVHTYLDGVEVSGSPITISTSGDITPTQTTNTVWNFFNYDGGTGNYGSHAYYDEWSMWSRALSPSEVTALYDAPLSSSNLSNNNDGTAKTTIEAVGCEGLKAYYDFEDANNLYNVAPATCDYIANVPDYDSDLSKMVYGQFGSLDDGVPAVQEQTTDYSQDFSNIQDDSTCDGWTMQGGSTMQAYNWCDTTNERIGFNMGNSDYIKYDLANAITGDWELEYTIGLTGGTGGVGVGVGTDMPDGSSYRTTYWGEITQQYNDWQILFPGCAACDSNAWGSISWQSTHYVKVEHDATTGTTFHKWYGSEADRTNDTNGKGTSGHSSESASVGGLDILAISNNRGGQLEGWIDDITLTQVTQPYVAPIQYDMRFQSTLGNAQSGTGLDFDGTDDYIQLDSKFDFLNKGDGSISFWVNPDTVNDNELIVNTMATSAANGAGIDITSKGTGSGLRVNLINSASQWNTNLNTPDPLTIGQWQHVVFTTKTVDGTQTAKIYIDGVLKDTEEYTPSSSSAGGDMRIGKHATDPNSYNYFDGKLDEFTIWDYEIDYFAIETLYDNGDGRDPSTLQNYIQNNVKPVVYYNFDDSSATNQYPPVQTAENTCEDITGNGCVASGDSVLHDGTLTGVSSTSGIVGKGMDFDGSNDYIAMTDGFDFQIDDPFSISLWFKTTSTSFQTFVNQWGTQNGGGNNGWLLIDSGTSASFRISSDWNGGNAIRVNTGTNSAFSDGAWHNLILSYDGTGHAGVKYYLDGVEEASTADMTGSVGTISYSLPMEIGAYSSTHSDEYDGQMDEIYVFNGKAITDAEAQSIYNAGLAGNQLSSAITTTSGAGTYLIDESGIHDAVIPTVAGAGGGGCDPALSYCGNAQTHGDGFTFGESTAKLGTSWKLDATNNGNLGDAGTAAIGLDDGVFPTADSFTFAFWTYIESGGGSGNNGLSPIWSQHDFAQMMYHGTNYSWGAYQMYYWQSGSGLSTYTHDQPHVSSGSWVHWVMTFDVTNNEYKTYKNNSLHKSATAAGNIVAQSNGEAFYIGTRGAGGNDEKADMWIDDFSIWRGRVLDANDVSALYNGGSGIVATDLPDQTGLYWYNSFDGDGSEVKNEGVAEAPTGSPTFEAGKVGTKALVSPQLSVTAKPITSNEDVTISSNAFSPTPLSIPTGSTVTWTNSDNTIHQVESTTLVDNASTQGDKFPVDVSTGVIDYTGHGTSEHHSVSAKLPSVAQDQWVLRFEHTVDSTISTSNGDTNVFIGISDDPTKHFQEGQDWIGSRLMLSAQSGGNGLIRPNSSDDSISGVGGSPQAGQCSNHYGYMGSGTENTKYYLELVRDGSDYDFSISSSNSYSGDVLNVDNCSVNGTPENLQYIKFGSSAGSSATHPWDGTIENVQFWDGTITASGDGSIAWQAPLFDSNNISASGGTYQRTFDTAGTYNYECPIHSGMTGQIVVADDNTLPSGQEDFTVSAWTKTTQVTHSANIAFDDDLTTLDSNWSEQFVCANNCSTPYSSSSNEFMSYDSSNGRWDMDLSNASSGVFEGNGFSIPLGVTLDENWILRYKMVVDSWSVSGNDPTTHMVMLGTNPVEDHLSSGDRFYYPNSYADDSFIRFAHDLHNHQTQLYSVDRGTANYDYLASGGGWDNGETGTYYIEFKKDGNTVSVTPYANSDFTGETTNMPSLSMTQSNWTNNDLDYLIVDFSKAQNGGGSDSFSWDGYIDDLQVCNGETDWANCTSTPPPPTDEIGTVLSFETQEAPTSTSTNYNAGVTWDSTTAVNININGNTVDTTNAGWSNYAQSTQTDITSGTIEITTDFYSDGRGMIGFGKDALGDNTTLDFACYGTDSSTNLMFMENGSVVHTVPSYTYTSSDVCKIEIESDGTVKYYVADQLKYTSSNTASGEYYVQAVLNKFSGGTTPSASVDLNYDSVTVTTYPVKTTAFEVEPTAMRIVDIEPSTVTNTGTASSGTVMTFDASSNYGGNDLGNITYTGCVEGATECTIEATPDSWNAYAIKSDRLFQQGSKITIDLDCDGGSCWNAFGFAEEGSDHTNGAVAFPTGTDGTLYNIAFGGRVADDGRTWYTSTAGSWTQDSTANGVYEYATWTVEYKSNGDMELKRDGTTVHTASGFTGNYFYQHSPSITSDTNGAGSITYEGNWENTEPILIRTNIIEETVTLPINTWKHVSWVKDGNDWKTFVDGTQAGSTVIDNTKTLGTAKGDPSTATFNSISTQYGGASQSPYSTGSSCNLPLSNGNSDTLIERASTSRADACRAAYHEWDVSSIPSDATVTKVSMKWDLTNNSSWSGVDDWELTTMTTQPSTAGTTTMSDEAINGTPYKQFSASDDESQLGERTIDLGADAITNLSGSDWFAVGIAFQDYNRSGHHAYLNWEDDVELIVEYSSPSLPSLAPNYYIGTQPDGATNPLAIIDELHIHADAEETVVDKSYDRGAGSWTLVASPAFVQDGGAFTFADPTVSPGDAPLYKISSYNLNGETELMTLVQGSTVTQTNPPLWTSNYPQNDSSGKPDLSWAICTDAGYGTISGYKIQYETGVGNGWSTLQEITNTATTTYNHATAVDGTTYNYRIACQNEAGDGQWSTEQALTAGIPPSVPLNFSVSTGTTTGISMDWDTPSDGGSSAISEYRILRSENGAAETTINCTTSDCLNNTQYTDTTVNPWDTYTYRVAGVNLAGNGPYTSTGQTTAGYAPTMPQNFNLSSETVNSINLAWNLPSDMGNGNLQGYQIFRNGTSLIGNAGTGTTYDDTTVTPGSYYSYAVGAINEGGTGALAPTLTGQAGYPPSNPTNANVTQATVNNILTDWDLPSDMGTGTLQNYIVNRNGTQLATPTASTWDDTTVVAGNWYEYTIRAVNEAGTGNSTSILTAQAGYPPTAPTNFAITDTTTLHIELDWDLPSDMGTGTLQNYIVNRNGTQLATPTASTYDDTTVQAGNYYEYAVLAVNEAGNGALTSALTGQAGYPPTMPTNATITEATVNNIKTEWKLPSDMGTGNLLGYQVVKDSVVVVNATMNDFYDDTNVVPGQQYVYEIATWNEAGLGEFTAQLTDTAGYAPSTPTNFIIVNPNVDYIELDWGIPSDMGTGSELGYKVWKNSGSGMTTLYEHNQQMLNGTASGFSVDPRLAGIDNQAWDFDGTDDYISFEATDFAEGNEDRTVAFWMNADGYSGDSILFTYGNGTGQSFTLQSDSSDFKITDQDQWEISQITAPLNSWHHVAVTHDGTTTKLYFDGSLAQSGTNTWETVHRDDNAHGLISKVNGFAAGYFDGSLDQLLFYNTDLTAQQVSDLWNNGNGVSSPPTTDLIMKYDFENVNSTLSSIDNTAKGQSLLIDYDVIPGNPYSYQVAGINEAGVGTSSSVLSTTAGYPPTAPNPFTVTSGDQFNSLVWTLPIDLGNGNLLGYKIQKINGTSTGDVSGPWFDYVANTNSASTTHTDTYLNLGDWYRYRVAAINEAGIGTYSANQTALSMSQPVGTISITVPTTLDNNVGGDAFTTTPNLESTFGSPVPKLTEIALWANGTKVDYDEYDHQLVLNVNENFTDLHDIMNTDTFHNYTLVATLENTLGTTTVTSTPIVVEPEYLGNYIASSTGNKLLNYTHTRNSAGDTIDLKVNRQDLPFNLECSYKSEIFADPTWKNTTQTGYYEDQLSGVAPTRNVYIVCYGSGEMFTTVSYGNTNATLSLIDFTNELGPDFLGVPIPFLFILFMAAIFTGRNAPVGIVFLAVTIGAMGLMGYFPDPSTEGNTITGLHWSLIVLLTAVGLFIGKRFI